MIPYEENNPYQDNLISALEKNDVHVNHCSVRPDLFIRHLLQNRDVDIIHIHWTYPFFSSDSLGLSILKSVFSLSLFTLLKLAGYSFVWTAHNLTAHDSEHETLEVHTKKFFCRYVCDSIIVHSQTAAEKISDQIGLGDESKLQIIWHGHFIDSYPNEIDRATARDRLGYNQDDVIYLFFGQIKEYKQVPELVRAFTEFSDDLDDNQLLVVGNPETCRLKDKIREECEDREDTKAILEFIPSEEVQLYMNSADVVVLPYSDIFTSGSALLAMSFGKPLIVPDIETLRDTLDSDGAIFYGDLDDLPEAMVEIYQRNLAAMGRNNFALVGARSWDDIAEYTKEVYKTSA